MKTGKITISLLRNLEKQVIKNEISYSRMVEILNETNQAPLLLPNEEIKELVGVIDMVYDDISYNDELSSRTLVIVKKMRDKYVNLPDIISDNKDSKVRMNWNRFFAHTSASFLGSMTTLFWLPFRQSIAIFISISIANLLMERLYFFYKTPSNS